MCIRDSCKAAIGSEWSSQFTDIQQLISGADAMMYKDKKDFYRKNSTSNRYRHHSDEALQLSDPEVLREEILKERFEVFFQPKIDVYKRQAFNPAHVRPAEYRGQDYQKH